MTGAGAGECSHICAEFGRSESKCLWFIIQVMLRTPFNSTAKEKKLSKGCPVRLIQYDIFKGRRSIAFWKASFSVSLSASLSPLLVCLSPSLSLLLPPFSPRSTVPHPTLLSTDTERAVIMETSRSPPPVSPAKLCALGGNWLSGEPIWTLPADGRAS